MLDISLFSKVLGNKIIKNTILENVKGIHRDHIKAKSIKWGQLVNDAHSLIYYNYIEELKNLPITNNYIPLNRTRDLLYFATKYDRFEIIKYLSTSPSLSNFKWNYNDALMMTPFANDIEVFLYICARIDYEELSSGIYSFYNVSHTITNAAFNSRTDIIDILIQAIPKNVCSFDNSIIDGGIKSGNLQIIMQYVECHYISIEPKPDDQYVDKCCKFNQFEILEYLHYLGIAVEPTKAAIDGVLQNGNLNMLKWLSFYYQKLLTKYRHNQTLDLNVDFLISLYYKQRGAESIRSIDFAAKNGHLDLVKWLHENQIDNCTEFAIDGASLNGHLEVVKWLHHNRTEGCTSYAFDLASFNGHLDVIKWLHENRSEGCTKYSLNTAAKNGHLDVVKWLHHNRTEGCTTDAMDYASQNGHLDVVIWLHENRTEGCTTWAMNLAAMYGHLETIKWLHENRTEGCESIHILNRVNPDDIELISWLKENRTECKIQR